MSSIQYKLLSNTPIEAIHRAWIDAFSDYAVPISTTLEELIYMLERRGYEPGLSLGAFDDDLLVGFTLNGLGTWQGKKTAYDTGTGLIKSYRRRGIASQIFDRSLPILQEHSVTQYLLEVLKPNKGAFDLYRKKGFEVLREFDCTITPKHMLQLKPEPLPYDVQIRHLDEADWDHLATFWDFEPSWQNGCTCIQRKWDNMVALGALRDETVVAYGIVEPHTGDIPQIAVHPSQRRRGLANALLARMLEVSQSESIRIINSDGQCESFRAWTSSLNMPVDIGQYEMMLTL